MRKVLLRAERRRRIPSQFSWIDQRLARDRYFERAPSEAWALYLFLATVADADGVSYYAERTLCARLGLSPERLGRARAALVDLELLAYRAPLAQLLALPEAGPPRAAAARLTRAELEQRLARLRAIVGRASP